MLKSAAVAAVLAAMLGSASAKTYYVDFMSIIPGSPYAVLDLSGPLYIDPSTIAGQMTIGTTSGKTFPSVWCVDLNGEIFIGGDPNIPYTTSATLPTNGYGTPVPVATQQEIQALADRGYALWKHSIGNLTNELPAIQGAMWALEYPTESVTSANASVEALIGSYETWAVVHPNADTSFLLDSPALGQNLAVGTPELSTWAMLLMGFAGLGFAGWRRTVRA